MIHYGMTKTAQLAIARGVAETVAGTGITVNSVLPGPTESEGVATFVADLARQRGVDRGDVEAEFFQTARPSSLLRRFATVEEVANMIVYVCSPLASAPTGRPCGSMAASFARWCEFYSPLPAISSQSSSSSIWWNASSPISSLARMASTAWRAAWRAPR